jgi:hypothetical protein
VIRSQLIWCIGIDIFAALLSIGALYLYVDRAFVRRVLIPQTTWLGAAFRQARAMTLFAHACNAPEARRIAV